jgi:hypothetical protein
VTRAYVIERINRQRLSRHDHGRFLGGTDLETDCRISWFMRLVLGKPTVMEEVSQGRIRLFAVP